MPRWSHWKVLIGSGKNLRKGAKDLPDARFITYELGIARGEERPRTTYVGHGNHRRLAIHRGSGWQNPRGHVRSSTELLPYAVPTVLNRYTIYYRYASMSSKLSAETAEHQLIQRWWLYPWNNKGMPWEGARGNWRRWRRER